MPANPVYISSWQLVVALIFVLLAQAASAVYRLGLSRDLWVGTVRTFAQLFLMGYVLNYVFRINLFVVMLALFTLMVVSGVTIVRGRIREKKVAYTLPVLVSMFVSFAAVSVVVTGVIIGADPWWSPRYFIPIAGMVIGNSMNSLAISLERLLADLRSQTQAVEMRLSLGATVQEASADIVAGAVRAGLIPAINAMMGVGLVFIPGMMTGQLLAGADPTAAVRYQIVVMLMLVGSTTLVTCGAVIWVRRRCFGSMGQLLLIRQ